MDRISSIAETTIHLAFVTTKLCLYDRWQCISLEIKKEELTETMEKSGVLCYTQTGPPGRDRTGAEEGGGEGSSEISVPGPPHYYSGP